MNDREAWVTRTFVELADTLVDDFDVVEFLSRLAGRTSELLDATEVGILLVDHNDNLRVMASSSERLRLLELFELQNEEGPCLDCYRSGEPILNAALADSTDRWPGFTSAALDAGFRMAHAVPMRVRDRVIGSVNILHDHERVVSDPDLALARALAGVATIGILQERAFREAAVLADQLQGALQSRIIIEQAKGMLAGRLSIGTEEAFSLLRRHARDHNRRLSDVAVDLLAGTLPTSELPPAPTTGPREEETS